MAEQERTATVRVATTQDPDGIDGTSVAVVGTVGEVYGQSVYEARRVFEPARRYYERVMQDRRLDLLDDAVFVVRTCGGPEALAHRKELEREADEARR